MRKGGERRVLLSTETEEQKKWGRPGNEANTGPHSDFACLKGRDSILQATKLEQEIA